MELDQQLCRSSTLFQLQHFLDGIGSLRDRFRRINPGDACQRGGEDATFAEAKAYCSRNFSSRWIVSVSKGPVCEPFR